MFSSVKTRRRHVAEIAAEREAAYEAYLEAELMDELTDQTERIPRPMENSFEYTRDDEGRLYTVFDDKRYYLEDVFSSGLADAEAKAAQDSRNWEFEATRRRIELGELGDIQALQDGEKIVIFSPIPDEVRLGRTSIGGYNRQRQKMLVRVAERRGDTTTISSFSLDQSNYRAMQQGALAVGIDIPDGLGSEEVLARRTVIGAESELSMDDIREQIRIGYDLSLGRELGGKWYAGRREPKSKNLYEFVKGETNLINQHMKVISDLKKRLISENVKVELLEKARYNLAAALDAKLQGKEFKNAEEAGDSARSSGSDYSGDCASSGPAGQAESLGYNAGRSKDEKKRMMCPYCGKMTFSDVCFPVCEQCGSTPGNDMSKVQKTPKAPTESIWEIILAWHEQSKATEKAKQRADRQQELGKRTLALV